MLCGPVSCCCWNIWELTNIQFTVITSICLGHRRTLKFVNSSNSPSRTENPTVRTEGPDDKYYGFVGSNSNLRWHYHLRRCHHHHHWCRKLLHCWWCRFLFHISSIPSSGASSFLWHIEYMKNRFGANSAVYVVTYCVAPVSYLRCTTQPTMNYILCTFISKLLATIFRNKVVNVIPKVRW